MLTHRDRRADAGPAPKAARRFAVASAVAGNGSAPQGPRGLAAIRAAAHVEMQMVVMIGVRIRAETDREAAAAALVNVAQEPANALVVASPSLLNRDPPSVG